MRTKTRPRKNRVVSLFGGALPIPAADSEVVDAAGEIMELARSGQAAGLIWGTVSPEGHISAGWAGKASSNSMTAAATILFRRITDLA